MKTAWSHIGVLFLCVCVALFGATLNAGTTMAYGSTQMVICSGDGAATVTIDANGNPVSPTAPASSCCDCMTCNAPTTVFLGDVLRLCAAPNGFSKLTITAGHQTPAPVIIARPQARGPPLTNLDNGSHTVPRCGLVCKDTTV